jgi:transcription initiation factor TFIIE subunit alpha
MEYQDYICPKCEHSYNALDAMTLLNPSTLLFHCEFCNSVLEQRDNSQKISSSRQMHGKLMEQLTPILKLLKETDNFVIPTHKKPPHVARNSKGVPIVPSGSTAETHLSKTGDAMIHDSIMVAGK